MRKYWHPGGKFKRKFRLSKTSGNKYGAKRTDGRASMLENAVFQVLKFKERFGLISDIKEQVRVDLGFGIYWKCDFSFFDLTEKRTTYAEAKGFRGERFRLCLKLWEDHGPGKLLIYEGNWKDPKLTKIVVPKNEVQS